MSNLFAEQKTLLPPTGKAQARSRHVTPLMVAFQVLHDIRWRAPWDRAGAESGAD